MLDSSLVAGLLRLTLMLNSDGSLVRNKHQLLTRTFLFVFGTNQPCPRQDYE
jgi:hypothetical protein